MYIITTYGNWDYECYAYDLSTVPLDNLPAAFKGIIESGEDIWGVDEGYEPDSKEHKEVDRLYMWSSPKQKWVEDNDYGKE